ncbi:DNA primase [Candidatus Nomurabacteria bacterium RIFCSPLOWO2_01_FULL_40_18]|uniref:DNA primase n=1 Tax=Candidatus Nomurabacteria bacterium RIFCSPLOWO2_01_FULL_40_18 TaxID=1801773 RepID=A0A1F6XIT0_9BACT|nr:MAG: DNA primase [Candidatus Nomurabacteria bacterium RIFCSPLOWO2_01_FULL_40_18]
MSTSVDQIKSRIDILTLVSSYMKLDKAGASWKGRCPFHNEKTPSFFVSPERRSYYCFGCGASGDIFTFVEEFEGLDFKGALKLLADKAGVKLEVYSKEMQEAEGEKEKLYRAMEEATGYFENNLKGNKEVFEYLKSRGLTEKSIKDFRIGFAILDWRQLYDHLKAKGFTDNETEKAGLAKKPEDKAKAMYDRFRGRIMFPITDSSGRVVAFSGRIFVDDGKSAKYLNSPETPIFSKNAVLYGIDKAKDSIRKNDFSILVEGQMDLILSHQAGYRNTIATSGTALSDSTVSKENVVSNLGLVRRLSQNIVLAFDADKAGANATIRAGKIALSLGMDVKVVDLPDGVDPADCVSKMGVDAWREAIKNSKHIIEFLLHKVLKSYQNDGRKAGREIKEKILPFVNALESSIEKTYFIKKISDSSSIPHSALEDDLKKIEQELKYEKEEIIEAKGSLNTLYRKDYIERKLLGIILWQRTLNKSNTDFENILKELSEVLHTTGAVLLEKTKKNEGDLIFEAEVFYEEGANLEKDVGEMLSNLKEEYLKEELEKKMRELHKAEEVKDREKSAEILKECQILSNKIQAIKNSRIKK